MGVAPGRSLVEEVQQGVHVPRLQRPPAPVVELRGPGGHSAAGVAQGGEVVGEEAGADDQDALVAQRGELAADLHEPDRVEGRHGDLQDGDVGLGEHLDQRDVRAVVQSAVRDVLHGDTGGAQQLAYGIGEFGGSGGAVRHLVVVLGEAPEVVDERDGPYRAEGEGGLLPVGGDHEDRLGAGQVRGPGGERAGPDRVVGERRRAVTQIEGGHALQRVGGHGGDSSGTSDAGSASKFKLLDMTVRLICLSFKERARRVGYMNMASVPDDEPQWLDDEEQRIWRSYVHATTLLEDHLDRQLQRDAGMPHIYYGLLVQLSRAPRPRLRMTDLAQNAKITRSRLSHAIARLEKNGWVRRENCPSDRRGQNAYLTDEGMRVLEKAAPGHVAAVRAAIFDRLSPEQVGHLAEICQVMTEGLQPQGADLPWLR